MQVAVVDSASVEDASGMSLAPLFTTQLDHLHSVLTTSAWIMTHRPFWGYGADDDTGELTTPTAQLRAAVSAAGLPDQAHLLVGANINLAKVLDFGEERLPQLIAANGGTQLVSRTQAPPKAIDGVEIQSSEVIYQYGFVAMEATDDQSWMISFRDVEGDELKRCRFEEKRVFCNETIPPKSQDP